MASTPILLDLCATLSKLGQLAQQAGWEVHNQTTIESAPALRVALLALDATQTSILSHYRAKFPAALIIFLSEPIQLSMCDVPQEVDLTCTDHSSTALRALLDHSLRWHNSVQKCVASP